MRILLGSEDSDWVSGSRIVSGLLAAGIVTDLADPIAELPSIARHSGPYDAMLLRPGHAGSAIATTLRTLRAAGVGTPAIVLLPHVSPEAERELLNRGADDVAEATDDAMLLAARLRALQRRTLGHSSALLSCGNVVLDQGDMRVTVDGRVAALTFREKQVLELFMLRRNRVLSKDQVMHWLYSDGDFPDARIVDVFICKIRRKLGSLGSPEIIRTVWGCGYMLEEPSAAALGGARARYAAGEGRQPRAHLSRRAAA